MNKDRVMNVLNEAETNAKIAAEYWESGTVWMIFHLLKALIYALVYIGVQIGKDKPPKYDL